MNNEVKKLLSFDQALKEAGIPIDGVSGTGPTCRIDYRAEATQDQRTQGDALRASFGWDDPLTEEEQVSTFCLDAKLLAAHNEVIYAIQTGGKSPQWAVDCIQKAHDQIVSNKG